MSSRYCDASTSFCTIWRSRALSPEASNGIFTDCHVSKRWSRSVVAMNRNPIRNAAIRMIHDRGKCLGIPSPDEGWFDTATRGYTAILAEGRRLKLITPARQLHFVQRTFWALKHGHYVENEVLPLVEEEDVAVDKNAPAAL